MPVRKTTRAIDIDGREVYRGDTVATLTGNMTAKVMDIASESDNTTFICLRPVHLPFSKGIWHAADQVQRIAAGKR